jgi:chemotaxis response regulator CheB
LPNDGFLQQLANASPDVLLVDLSEDTGSETDIIDTLLDYDELPIFFNDSSPAGGGANAMWAKKLARKLSDIASHYEPAAEPIVKTMVEAAVVETAIVEPSVIETSTETLDGTVAEPSLEPIVEPIAKPSLKSIAELSTDAELESLSLLEIEDTTIALELETADSAARTQISPSDAVTDEPELSLEIIEEPSASSASISAPTVSPTTTEKPEGAAVNIWVLGASLGGPQAVRQFLAAIEDDLPVAFVLAHHIGANHISLLAEQLNRVTPFTVLAGRAGHLLRHHEVVLTPAEKDIKITDDGYLSLIPAQENAIYSPSIDNVIDAVASHYGNMAGTIVFSGMGDDGAKGCESMAQHGGVIWAQDMDSCVISSMPDQARKTNTVTFSANPRALAERLYQYYQD